MAKLILSVDGQVLKEHVLTKERTLIGRKPHNDIQIDNLAVSGEHAAIITILNDSFIEDLGSTNGTMVNGKPIKKHFLQANDVIEIGKHKLKYFAEGASQVAGDDFEKTMIIRSPAKPAEAPAARASSDTVTNLRAAAPEAAKPATPPPPPAAPAPAAKAPAAPATAAPVAPARAAPAAPPPPPAPAAPAAAAAGPAGEHASLPEAAIQVLSGAAAGRTLDITKNLTTIGKPGLQVAVITKRPHGFFITHVEGATYPTLNGASLGATAHPLADHDMIEIAGVKMEFFFKT